jgi:hypothetical protein
MSEIRAVAGSADGRLPRKSRESAKRDDEERSRPKRSKEPPVVEANATGTETRKLNLSA